MDTPASTRFTRIHAPFAAGKARNRLQPSGVWDERRGHPGDFLGRLWAIYGPPDEVGDDGYTYFLRDEETGLSFTAYSEASGPAYGGAPADFGPLAPVLDAFDALIDATPPVACSVVFGAPDDAQRVGWAVDAPFLEPAGRDTMQWHEELARAAALQQSDLDPWDAVNALVRLAAGDAALENAALTARPLWQRAFALVAAALETELAAHPLRAGEIETLAEVALEQLREFAPRLGLDPAEYGTPIDRLQAAARAALGYG